MRRLYPDNDFWLEYIRTAFDFENHDTSKKIAMQLSFLGIKQKQEMRSLNDPWEVSKIDLN